MSTIARSAIRGHQRHSDHLTILDDGIVGCGLP
jgi:hypothetical protein